MENNPEHLVIFATTGIGAAVGGFLGAFGYWAITRFFAWLGQPNPKIEFDKGYPFRSEAVFKDGKGGIFISVRIKNNGKQTAHNCRVFVRKICLNPNSNSEKAIQSDYPMQTLWVPREAKLTEINIPSGMEFYANIAFVHEQKNIVHPVFQAGFAVCNEFSPHVGDFQVDVIVAGDNFDPVQKPIRFRHPKGNPDLIPLPTE